MGKENNELFSTRERIRKWKSVAGVLHLLTVTSLVLSVAWVLPRLDNRHPLLLGQEVQRQMERRQLVIEALDKMARYQKYYYEINGRFTRDLSRLAVPETFASGSRADLVRDYEISVLEARPHRFVLLAAGTTSSDRITIDESHRLNANFVMPAPTRAYLQEEADRLLRLRSHGISPDDSLFARYWELTSYDSRAWVAVGVRKPVLGDRREGRADATIFASVRERVQNRVGEAPPEREPAALGPSSGLKDVLSARDVTDWLEAAHLAQHAHFRERGRYARRWEELDLVSNYRFGDRIRSVKNLRVYPIELAAEGYRLTLEGTSGELMGEQFSTDKTGSVRQVRYTETLIQQLQETTNILENFQINPINEESPAERP